MTLKTGRDQTNTQVVVNCNEMWNLEEKSSLPCLWERDSGETAGISLMLTKKNPMKHQSTKEWKRCSDLVFISCLSPKPSQEKQLWCRQRRAGVEHWARGKKESLNNVLFAEFDLNRNQQSTDKCNSDERGFLLLTVYWNFTLSLKCRSSTASALIIKHKLSTVALVQEADQPQYFLY